MTKIGPTAPTDEELIRETLAGAQNAFALLIGRYRPMVCAVAWQALHDSEAAQDVAQEVFLYAYQHLTDIRDAARFPGYLRQATLSLCAEHRRRRATRTLPQIPVPFSRPTPDPNADAPDRIALRQALAKLPAPLRLTLTLFHTAGYSHEEIARLTDAPINTVRSRLQRARRTLYDELKPLFPERTMMPAMAVAPKSETTAGEKQKPLPPHYETMIQSVFPDARVTAVEWEPEAWMPFSVRARLTLPDGSERRVDFRWDITDDPTPAEDRALPGVRTPQLLEKLARLGLPVPHILAGPTPDSSYPGGNPVTMTETSDGGNLLLWSLEENLPHRIREATTLGIQAIDRLHGLTDALLADPIAAQIPRRPLSRDLEEILQKGGPWLEQPLFAEAVARLKPIVEAIDVPLVYTNDLYFPNFLRVKDGKVVEYVWPWGHFGDPLLGLAKFWTYDCYPFVHTGFVERYLYEKRISRQEFAPRLAVRTLWTLQRELPVERPDEGAGYWDALMTLLKHALQDL